MRARALMAAAGITVLLSGCGLTASDIPVPGGGAGGETYELTAVFTDALNLPAKAKVKLDGVDIGRVESMEVDGDNARVKLAILEEYDLPTDSKFKLRQTSALGEVYVAVMAPEPTGETWVPGSTIGPEHTGQAPGVEDALASLSLLTNGGGIAQVTTIVRESQAALSGNAGNVDALLDQVSLVLATLDGRSKAIGTILERSASITRRVRNRDRTIDAALRDLPPAIKILNGQTDELVALLESFDRLSKAAHRVVSTVQSDVLGLLRTLGPTLDGFAALDKDIHRVFGDMIRFYDIVVQVLPNEAAAGYLEVTGILPDGSPSGLPDGSEPPAIGPLPGLPGLPGVPGVPGLPTLPPLPEVPLVTPLLEDLLGLRATPGGSR